MGRQSYLYRRPSGIYVVRVAVPHRHRVQIGRGEIHVSTGIRNPRQASIAALPLVLQWKQHFLELDEMDIVKIADGSPLLRGDGHLQLIEAAAALGMEPQLLLQEIANHGAALYCFASQWKGYIVREIRDIDREDDGGFIINSAVNIGLESLINGVVSIVDADYFVQELARNNQCTFAHVRLQPGGEHVFFDTPFRSVRVPDVLVAKADIERIRRGYAAAVAPDALVAARARVLAPPAPTRDAKHAGMRVSELIDKYVKAKSAGWRLETRNRVRVMLRPFVELMGDPKIGGVERSTVRDYMDELQRLPRDARKARRSAPVSTAQELIGWADGHGVDRMHARTARLYVAKLSELLKWAVIEQYVASNAAAGVAEHKRHAKRAQDARDIFEDSELALIFGARWFQTGVGQASKSGRYFEFQPHFYWLPLLALYTGGRINELSQLYLDDVVSPEGGSAYVHFRLNAADKRDVDDGDATGVSDKRLKTVNSERIVPLRAHLVELGLLEYVGHLRAAGHQRLFPELRLDAVKGYGKAATSWFNERYLGNKLGMARNGRKTFHSLRHQFLTTLDRLGVQETIVAQLAGHERGETMSATRYRKDQDAGPLRPHIDKLVYALPPIARFDSPEGVRAVEDALLRKQQNGKRVRPSGTAQNGVERL
jgi:integrase